MKNRSEQEEEKSQYSSQNAEDKDDIDQSDDMDSIHKGTTQTKNSRQAVTFDNNVKRGTIRTVKIIGMN